MLHAVGMPAGDADYIHGQGGVVGELLQRARPRSTLFTGSQRVAERLCADLGGRVRAGTLPVLAAKQSIQQG